MGHFLSNKTIGLLLLAIVLPLVWGCSVPPDRRFISEYNGPVTLTFAIPSSPGVPLPFNIESEETIRLRNTAEGQNTWAYIGVSAGGDLQLFPGQSVDFLAALGFGPFAPFLADLHLAQAAYVLDDFGVQEIILDELTPISVIGDFERMTISDGETVISTIESVAEFEDLASNPQTQQLVTTQANGEIVIELVPLELAE